MMDAIRDAYNWLRAAWLGLAATVVGDGMSFPEVLNAGAAIFTIVASIAAICFGWQKYRMQKRQLSEYMKTQSVMRDHIEDASLPVSAAMSIASRIAKEQARMGDK